MHEQEKEFDKKDSTSGIQYLIIVYKSIKAINVEMLEHVIIKCIFISVMPNDRPKTG